MSKNLLANKLDLKKNPEKSHKQLGMHATAMYFSLIPKYMFQFLY